MGLWETRRYLPLLVSKGLRALGMRLSTNSFCFVCACNNYWKSFVFCLIAAPAKKSQEKVQLRQMLTDLNEVRVHLFTAKRDLW